MYFEVVGKIEERSLIAAGTGVRERARLLRTYGQTFWRKYKGVAMVSLIDDTVREAEVHWYEAHGVGRREMKIKRFLS